MIKLYNFIIVEEKNGKEWKETNDSTKEECNKT